MFRVGDQVKLSAIGRKTYPNNFHDNPHEEVGVVEGDFLGYPMPYSAGLRGITVTVMLKECLE